MNTIEIKRKLHTIIDQEDDQSIEVFYHLINSYILQKQEEKMIVEGEEDIEKGLVYSLKEAKDIMDKW